MGPDTSKSQQNKDIKNCAPTHKSWDRLKKNGGTEGQKRGEENYGDITKKKKATNYQVSGITMEDRLRGNCYTYAVTPRSKNRRSTSGVREKGTGEGGKKSRRISWEGYNIFEAKRIISENPPPWGTTK